SLCRGGRVAAHVQLWQRNRGAVAGSGVRLHGCADQAGIGNGRSAALRRRDRANGITQPAKSGRCGERGAVMAEPIVMPNLGAGTEEGTLINWLKQGGDTVNDGDVIAEVDADKATVEVPVTVSGTILSLDAEPGASLKVGSVIGYVGQPGENVSGAKASQSAPQPAAQGNGAAVAQERGTGAPPAQTEAP